MIRLVRIANRQVPVSNPDKLFFPVRGLTKGDLVRYYLEVADCLLHHVRNRPMHASRYRQKAYVARACPRSTASRSCDGSFRTRRERRSSS